MRKMAPVLLAATLTFAAGAASADTDPKLQALLDQRAGQLSEDAQRLSTLNQLDQEQSTLERNIGDLGPDARQAAAELEAKADEFKAASEQLAADLRNAAGNLDNFSRSDLRDIDQRSDNLRDLGDQLAQLADAAVENGVRRENFNSITFFSQAVVVIYTNLVTQMGNLGPGFLSQNDAVLGPLADRLNGLANEVEDFGDQGQGFNNGIRQADFNRLDELQDGEEERQDEVDDIEQRAEFAGNGAGVLAALGDRLEGNAGTDLSGDQQAGDRVQELAEGLAGAGQRLEEIQNEINELNDQLLEREAEIIAAEIRAFELGLQAADQDRQEEAVRVFENLLENGEQRVEQLRNEGAGEFEIRDAELALARFEGLAEVARNAAENPNQPSDAERKALNDAERDANKSLNVLFQQRKDLNDRKKALQEERQQIAALQGELENLIRNGAPLGDENNQQASADNKSIDQYLASGDTQESGENAGDPPSDGQKLLEDIAKSTPLGLDQFGFDADQGGTEGITGFNANGGFNLIPCPPGSNALPPGTLVSDTAICFT